MWYAPFCFNDSVLSSWHTLYKLVQNLTIHLRFQSISMLSKHKDLIEGIRKIDEENLQKTFFFLQTS